MATIDLVSPKQMSSSEQFGASLVVSLFSLKTMMEFQLKAFKLGFFSQDDEELSKTIIWELKRIEKLIERQADSVLEKTPMTAEMVQASLQELAFKGRKPNAGKPKKEAHTPEL